MRIYGIYGTIDRPLIIGAFVAAASTVVSLSFERLLKRTDSAESRAALEHTVAENRRQLEVGSQHIQDMHVHIANGDFNVRPALDQANPLWGIERSLLNLVGRLRRYSESEHMVQRMGRECDLVATALADWKAGRPATVPVKTGTPVDKIIDVISRNTPATSWNAPLGPSLTSERSSFLPGPMRQGQGVEPQGWPGVPGNRPPASDSYAGGSSSMPPVAPQPGSQRPWTTNDPLDERYAQGQPWLQNLPGQGSGAGNSFPPDRRWPSLDPNSPDAAEGEQSQQHPWYLPPSE